MQRYHNPRVTQSLDGLRHEILHPGGSAIEEEQPSFLAREVEQVADELRQPIGFAADCLQEMALVCKRPGHVFLEQRRGVPFDRCQWRAQFVANRCQQRRLKFVEFALARYIAQQQATTNGLPRLVVHIEQPQVDCTAPAISPDLNHQLRDFGGLSSRQGPLAIHRILGLRAQRIVERADGAAL